MDARLQRVLFLASVVYGIVGLGLVAAAVLIEAAPYTPPAGCTGGCPSSELPTYYPIARNLWIAMVVFGATAAIVLSSAATPVLTRLDEQRILDSIEPPTRRD